MNTENSREKAMSEIRLAYPVREMLELIEQPTVIGVPVSACWWRLQLLPQPDGISYETHIDNIDQLNPDAKTTVTWRWSDDGHAEVVEPYAARITTDRDEPPFLGIESTIRSMPRVDVWIDALSMQPPTSNPRWLPFTARGNHRHPDMMAEIEKRRRELGLVPTWGLNSVRGSVDV